MDEYLLLCEQIVGFEGRRHLSNVQAIRDLFFMGCESTECGMTQKWQESAFEDFARYVEAGFAAT